MEEYFKELCAPHFWPIVITIAVMLLLMGSGVALRPLLKQLINAGLKRLSGESTEVNVNLGTTETGEIMAHDKAAAMCAGCPGMTDPAKCPLHEAEVRGRIANENAIKEIKEEMIRIWQHHEKLKEDFQKELKDGLASVVKVAKENKDSIIQNQDKILAAIEKRRGK